MNKMPKPVSIQICSDLKSLKLKMKMKLQLKSKLKAPMIKRRKSNLILEQNE